MLKRILIILMSATALWCCAQDLILKPGKELVIAIEPPAPSSKPLPLSDPTYFIQNNSLQGAKSKIRDGWLSGEFVYIPVLFQGTHNMSVFYSTNTANDLGRPNDVDRDPSFTNGGSFMLSGVPFTFGVYRNNIWNSYECGGDGPHSLVVDVQLRGVVKVYTLINTLGGVRGDGLAKIEFRGDKGARHTVPLAGDRELRDWHEGPFTNLLAPPHTMVWHKAKARMDRQCFVLPKEFETQVLESIILTDMGKRGKQKMVLFGITIQARAGELQ